jgi:predicted RNase H-like HicB family nuclease
MANQTLKKNKDSFEVQVDVVVFEENGTFIALCPALGISSYGDTEEEAKMAFDGAMDIFLKETHKKGTLEKYLLKQGWQLQQKPVTLYQPPTLSLKQSKKILHNNAARIYNERVAMPV